MMIFHTIKIQALQLFAVCIGLIIVAANSLAGPSAAAGNDIPLLKLDHEMLQSPYRLAVPWAFAWQDFYLPSQGQTADWQLKKLGEAWPDKGFASYAIELEVPEDIGYLKLILPRIQGGVKVWVNDKLYGQAGIPAKSKELSVSKAGNVFINFPVEQSRFQIILHLSSFHHRRPGSFHPPLIALPEVMNKHYHVDLISDSWMVGTLLVMAFWNFMIFMLNYKNSHGALPFGLCCLAVGLRVLIVGDASLIYNLLDISFLWHYRLDYLSFYSGLVFLASFIHTLFPFILSRTTLIVIVTLGAVFSLITLLTPVEFFSELLIVMQLTTIFSALLVIIGSLHAMIKRITDSELFLLSQLFFAFASINDILIYLNLIESIMVSQYGFVGFLFLQSFLISKRFIRAEKLDQEQKLATDTIRRSQKLYESHIHSLDHVQGIESKFFYRFAELTGGDWLVVHWDEKCDQVFVALGDVSGHGINSALFTLTMTSAVKQGFVTLAGQKFDPQQMIEAIQNINRTVLEPADLLNKHITVVFLAIELKSRECHYFNSAHCSLILSQKKGVRTILQAGSPLGMMENIDVGYDVFQLEQGDTLLLYTDGLVENGSNKSERIRIRDLLQVMKPGADVQTYETQLENLIKSKWSNIKVEDDAMVMLIQLKERNELLLKEAS